MSRYSATVEGLNSIWIYRIQLQCLDVVQDIDAASAESYRLGLRIMLRPIAGIDVPSDGNDSRNPLQSGDHVWRTDIASVDDVRHAGEALLNLWTQEPVSVRDDSDFNHCANVPRCLTLEVCVWDNLHRPKLYAFRSLAARH
jgi:hypothetical protein